jgi:hypothetical protein
MKKVFAVLSIAALFAACIDKDDVKKVNLTHIEPFTTKVAPVKTDTLTVIKADTAVICVTTVPLEYNIPKGSNVTIEYYPLNSAKAKSFRKGYENGGGYQSGDGNGYTHFTACFEDSKNGDNDYNDFVCFITKINTVENWWGSSHTITSDVYVQPMALGAGAYQDSLAFGIKFSDGSIWMVTQDIKSDMFDDSVAYINTTYAQVGTYDGTGYMCKKIFKYSKTFPYSTTGNVSRINPFVYNKATHDTIFIAVENHSNEQYNYNSIISTKGVPFGIAIFNTFPYPLEKVAISTAYPNFKSWLLGDINSFPTSYLSGKVCLKYNSLVLWNPQWYPYYWITYGEKK